MHYLRDINPDATVAEFERYWDDLTAAEKQVRTHVKLQRVRRAENRVGRRSMAVQGTRKSSKVTDASWIANRRADGCLIAHIGSHEGRDGRLSPSTVEHRSISVMDERTPRNGRSYGSPRQFREA